jgi:hypothetical protein
MPTSSRLLAVVLVVEQLLVSNTPVGVEALVVIALAQVHQVVEHLRNPCLVLQLELLIP